MTKRSNFTSDPNSQIISDFNNPLTIFEEEDEEAFKLKKVKPKETKIIFFGNTQYSTIGAQILDQTFPLSLVVTIPDRETGRKKTLTPSPVKIMAQRLGIPIIEANKLDPDIIHQIANLQPDFLVVEDYGLILPQALLDIPKYAPLNIHHSLLPKYRGPSPAPTAILNGEKISGVTIIKMTNKVDAGDIMAQQKYELQNNETTDTLRTQLNSLGGELIISVIKDYLAGTIQSIPQNEDKMSMTKFIKKQDGYFDIANPPSPETLDRMIRAYYPWPHTWTRWNEKIVKFLPASCHPEPACQQARPVSGSDDKFVIQMEGKKPVSLKDFLNGYPDFPNPLG